MAIAGIANRVIPIRVVRPEGGGGGGNPACHLKCTGRDMVPWKEDPDFPARAQVLGDVNGMLRKPTMEATEQMLPVGMTFCVGLGR